MRRAKVLWILTTLIIFVFLINSMLVISIYYSGNDPNTINSLDLSKSITEIQGEYTTRSIRDTWTDNFESDILIEEMKGVEILNNNVELLKKDFMITSTNDFENGTKSNSNGNYEIETSMDNPGIEPNQIELGSGKGDCFNFDDPDADTWKWDIKETIVAGGSGTYIHNISNGWLNHKIVNGNKAHCGAVSKFTIDKNYDFEVQIKIDTTSKNSETYFKLSILDQGTIRPDFAPNINGLMIQYYASNQIRTFKWKSGAIIMIGDHTVGNQNLVYFKIDYIKSSNTFTSYYCYDGTSWTKNGEFSDVTLTTNPYVISMFSQTTITSTQTASFDDYILNKGRLLNGYRTDGVWESAPIELNKLYTLVDT